MDAWLNETVAILTAVVLLALLARWMQHRRRGTIRPRKGSLIPPGLRLRPQPFLTKSEADLYNLLQLAAQDHYLVFTQVPLWALVDLRAQTPETRAALLKTIALRRVDFVLVHPGTLTVAKVIDVEHEHTMSEAGRLRRDIIAGVLRAAGIDLIRLKSQDTYTLPALARALGLERDEV